MATSERSDVRKRVKVGKESLGRSGRPESLGESETRKDARLAHDDLIGLVPASASRRVVSSTLALSPHDALPPRPPSSFARPHTTNAVQHIDNQATVADDVNRLGEPSFLFRLKPDDIPSPPLQSPDMPPTVLLLRAPPEDDTPDKYESAFTARGYRARSLAVLETVHTNTSQLVSILRAGGAGYAGVVVTSARACEAWRAAVESVDTAGGSGALPLPFPRGAPTS